ncbi:MAG: hypothetical protein LBK60_12215 [Verrucomicrobiales bacterium]|nr:hypothetical protein [Verrucomicrobiales bacterium]
MHTSIMKPLTLILTLLTALPLTVTARDCCANSPSAGGWRRKSAENFTVKKPAPSDPGISRSGPRHTQNARPRPSTIKKHFAP